MLRRTYTTYKQFLINKAIIPVVTCLFIIAGDYLIGNPPAARIHAMCFIFPIVGPITIVEYVKAYFYMVKKHYFERSKFKFWVGFVPLVIAVVLSIVWSIADGILCFSTLF